jgi:hypothetical protein
MLALMLSLAPCFTGFAHANDPAAAGFFRAVEDLPLMPGMTEIESEAVVFDQPEGRVVQVTAHAPLGSGGAVATFYEQTLPQLGWQKEGQGEVPGNVYVRDKERLTIEYGAVMGGPLPVRFTIKPR